MANESRETEQTSVAEPAEESQAVERVYVASQWQLMWWRFRRHKLAMVGIVVIMLLYLISLSSEFLSPYDPEATTAKWSFVPPQTLHVGRVDGRLTAYVYGLKMSRDPESLKAIYTLDPTLVYPVKLWVHGASYRYMGLIRSDVHLFGVAPGSEGTVFVFGTDRLGRDMLSRVAYGTRISMSIGLVGVALSFVLGIIIGGFSGLYGGLFDTIAQRAIEILRSIPTIPLWLGLSAAIPKDWPQLRVYFFITIILSLVGWTGLARVVRGRFLSLRQEDFVTASRIAGGSDSHVLARHLVPSILSHIIASLTLSIPGMILSETALSFLNLGLRSPTISWGVLLQEAQNVRTVALAPWLMIPALFVAVTVLAFNFMGDGLRDAADPYA
jgi:peptide/nickel transport system permease protein